MALSSGEGCAQSTRARLAYSLWLIAYGSLPLSICHKQSAICDFPPRILAIEEMKYNTQRLRERKGKICQQRPKFYFSLH